MDLKIIGWTNYDSCFPSIEVAQDEVNDLILTVAGEIKNNGYMLSGDDHQNSDTGVPVFENGTCFRASMRAWGFIMAVAFPEINGNETQYMDFYMSTPLERKLPVSNNIDVTPASFDNFNALISPQDSEMLSQSVQMGIPFMTTDKALNSLMDQIKEIIAQADNDEENN